jgi:hypothetical protein
MMLDFSSPRLLRRVAPGESVMVRPDELRFNHEVEIDGNIYLVTTERKDKSKLLPGERYSSNNRWVHTVRERGCFGYGVAGTTPFGTIRNELKEPVAPARPIVAVVALKFLRTA